MIKGFLSPEFFHFNRYLISFRFISTFLSTKKRSKLHFYVLKSVKFYIFWY